MTSTKKISLIIASLIIIAIPSIWALNTYIITPFRITQQIDSISQEVNAQEVLRQDIVRQLEELENEESSIQNQFNLVQSINTNLDSFIEQKSQLTFDQDINEDVSLLASHAKDLVNEQIRILTSVRESYTVIQCVLRPIAELEDVEAKYSEEVDQLEFSPELLDINITFFNSFGTLMQEASECRFDTEISSQLAEASFILTQMSNKSAELKSALPNENSAELEKISAELEQLSIELSAIDIENALSADFIDVQLDLNRYDELMESYNSHLFSLSQKYNFELE